MSCASVAHESLYIRILLFGWMELYPATLPLDGAHTQRAVYPPLKGAFTPQWPWLPGYATWCMGAIQGKEGGIQVLAGLAPSSQTVGSNIRVINEQGKRSS